MSLSCLTSTSNCLVIMYLCGQKHTVLTCFSSWSEGLDAQSISPCQTRRQSPAHSQDGTWDMRCTEHRPTNARLRTPPPQFFMQVKHCIYGNALQTIKRQKLFWWALSPCLESTDTWRALHEDISIHYAQIHKRQQLHKTLLMVLQYLHGYITSINMSKQNV